VPDSPKFKNPPVVETVLGVQFPELEGFRATHFGLYWELLRERYPKVTDRDRLDPVHERFPQPLIPQPQFQALQQMPLGRVWFTAKNESGLIQLQPDRFLLNWRRQKENGEYPSYQKNSDIFLQEFDGFCCFCQGKQLQQPTPELCEVTYINHIHPRQNESAMELAGKLFSGVRWEGADGFLPIPERFVFNRAYVIKDNGKAIGRLYAEASIAVRQPVQESQKFVLFKVTARVNHLVSCHGNSLTMSHMPVYSLSLCGKQLSHWQ
jgi:uncharacterized protein (TIGR04255 family)